MLSEEVAALENELAVLESENRRLKGMVDVMAEQLEQVQAENNILQQIAYVVGRQKGIWRSKFACLPDSLQELIRLHDRLPADEMKKFYPEGLENQGIEGSADHV